VKRLMVLVMALLVLTLVGCGGGKQTEEEKAKAVEAKRTQELQLSYVDLAKVDVELGNIMVQVSDTVTSLSQSRITPINAYQYFKKSETDLTNLYGVLMGAKSTQETKEIKEAYQYSIVSLKSGVQGLLEVLDQPKTSTMAESSKSIETSLKLKQGAQFKLAAVAVNAGIDPGIYKNK